MKFLSVLGQATEYDYGQYGPSYETLNNMNSASTTDPAVATAAFMGIMIFALIGALIGYVINAFLLSRIFKKAGVETWKAWVPVYNVWVTLELGGQNGWWAIVMLIPFVNIVGLVFYFIAAYHIGLKLGKEGAFVLLAIFLPIVWLAWLAFDKSTWNGAAAPTAGVPAAPQQSTPTSSSNEEQNPPVPPTTPTPTA